MAAAATYKKPRAMAGMVNGSLAYDFGTLERQLENTGRMDPDLYSLPLEETSADVILQTNQLEDETLCGGQKLLIVK